MATSEEGASVLSAMFKAEHDLIKSGALPSDNYLYVAKVRPAADVLIRTLSSNTDRRISASAGSASKAISPPGFT
jgi:hypothetical protein